MSETAAIESINVEQIATVTDLLLLRARTTRRRFSTNRDAFAYDHRSGRSSRPSIPSLPQPVAPAAPPDEFRDPELTLFVRARKVGTSTATAAIVATVFAVGIVITSFL